MGFTVKSFDQIVTDMVAIIIANSSQITDLSPGSVIRSYCEGAGLCLEELYIGVYLGFRRYLDEIQENVFDFDRKAGTKATTNAVFSRSGTSGDVTIPQGTRVKTASGLRFSTTAQGQITNGNTDSDPIEVEAEKVGTAYNVASGTITIIEDEINGVESVTNANAATGGVDQESDHEFKKRFQAYIEGLAKSNVAGLKTAALDVDGITSASVVELFPPVSNVNVKVYIDDGSSGGVSDAKVTEVQNAIDGEGTDEKPGYRSAGINVSAVKPGIVTQDVTATLTLLEGVDTDEVKTAVNQALTNYVNGLGVGADIIHSELVAAIMGVYGITDCDVTTPSANVTVADTQVGRVGTITLNIA